MSSFFHGVDGKLEEKLNPSFKGLDFNYLQIRALGVDFASDTLLTVSRPQTS